MYVIDGRGGDSVEVDSSTLHDPEKFSMACMEQINKPLMPVGKIIWRKMLTKLFASIKEEKAPDSSKIDVQIKELLGDFINKAPGKKIEDIKRGLPFTEDEFTYFKFSPKRNFSNEFNSNQPNNFKGNSNNANSNINLFSSYILINYK